MRASLAFAISKSCAFVMAVDGISFQRVLVLDMCAIGGEGREKLERRSGEKRKDDNKSCEETGNLYVSESRSRILACHRRAGI